MTGWQAALIEVLIRKLAPEVADLVVQIIRALTRRLAQAGVSPQTLAEQLWPDAVRIVRGIEHDHPDWRPEQKQQWARDAIAVLIQQAGGSPADNAVNWIIESAVLYAKQPAEGS